MAMVNFTTVRTQPPGPAVSRYRNLMQVEYADVIQHTDSKWYCHAVDDTGQEFYFGDPNGYASSAAATAAIITILP